MTYRIRYRSTIFYGIHRFRTFFAVDNFTIAAGTFCFVCLQYCNFRNTNANDEYATGCSPTLAMYLWPNFRTIFSKYKIKRNKKLGRKSGELKCKPIGENVADQKGCGCFKILTMPKFLYVRIGYRVIVTGAPKTMETERSKLCNLNVHLMTK